ncbi:OPT family small oligopeptide transporter [Phascolomyces articulosus]|uniref:OPT family small oligopeptide transporter n=1 Tax=Phascolomyces articulosus TaxID=60185 RepID=A0AAD5KA93_9FUNG|nr:OPT family small oligopeptide transporter [Phascolomyces articulosus]
MNDEKKTPKDDPVATPEIYYEANSSTTWESSPEKLKDEETSTVIDEQQEDENSDIKIVNELASMEDDTSLPCFTLRALFVGAILACLSASVYQLMLFKPVGLPLSNTFMLMVAYVVCNAWARYLPKVDWLNPGPFNVKEHTCIYVMVSAANTSAYATFILSAQQLYYTDPPGPAGSIFLLFATQIVGYGIAGQLRKFLVYPPDMIWPTSLPTVSLLRTLNSSKSEARWRTRFFFIIFTGMFVYEFIPQYIFPLLGGISIFCLANTSSVWFQRLFGGLAVNEGLGIFQLSFDWNYLSAMNPLVLPLWVQLNVFGGILLMWLLYPLIYHYDVWDAQRYPFLSNSIYLFNETAQETIIYPQHLVLNQDNSLNQTMLDQVGRPSFPATSAVNYVFINFAVTASIAHVALFYGKRLWGNMRSTRNHFKEGKMDIHNRLMAAYKEVPAWWYYTIFVIGIGLNIGIAYINHSQLPWWGVLLAIAISTVLSLPLNLITAVTGQGFGLNVFAEMICGFILPGLPVANMYFKTLGFNTLNQAGLMANDLKIGHYLKVPPRIVFLNQILGTILGSLFNYIVNDVMVTNERDILLNPVGNNVWNGATPQTINSAAITWGAIGPINMFGPSTRYYIVLWAFIIGFFLPLPFWYLHKRFPQKGFDRVNIPMILVGLCTLPGAATSYITISFCLVVFSQYYLRRYRRHWFVKYNYLVSTGLDSATSLMVFFVAFALHGAADGIDHPFPIWWGNRQDAKYLDYCCLDCKQ